MFGISTDLSIGLLLVLTGILRGSPQVFPYKRQHRTWTMTDVIQSLTYQHHSNSTIKFHVALSEI